MKQIYFGTVVTILLLIQYNITNGREQHASYLQDIGSSVFIENKGQITDQFKNPRTDIDFVLHGKGINIFISAGKISYQFIKDNTTTDAAQTLKAYTESKFAFPSAASNIQNHSYNLYRLDMVLDHADFTAVPLVEMPSAARFNYYLPGCGPDGLINISSCRRIVYPEIYPGVDWVVYLKDGKLKYDFILHRGADQHQIAIQYKGATSQTLAADGSLEITTPLGKITEEAPIAWTEADHKNIPIAFEAGNGVWHFKTGSWKGTLVLDPGLSWSTYYGGSGMDIAKDVCTHNATVYLTGLTTSLNQIATTGTYQTNYYGGIEGDAFIAKFTSDGSLIWATYFGGNKNDLGWSMVTDPSGNAYVAGYTESTVGIASPGSLQTVFGGDQCDGFLAKFSATGQRLWSTYYGGSGPDYSHSLAIDNGYLYMCGLTYSNAGISTPGSYQPVHTANGGNTGNAFLTKWDLNGNRLWGTYFGAGTTTASSVTVDPDHGIYIAGSSNAPDGISTGGSHQSTLGGLNDNFIAKFNPAGQRQWSTYFGGISNESTFPVVLAGQHNNIYLAGITYSYNQIATPGTSRPVFSNGVDGYLASFTAAGVQEWGTYVGPGPISNGVYIADISLGNCGNIYVTGDIYPSVGLIPSADAYKQTPGGGSFDGALIRYDLQGRSNYCSYIGGGMEDNMSALSLSNDGNLYLAGITQSDSDMASDSAYQSVYGGIKDAFLMKFQDIAIGDKENPNAVFDSVRCINDTFPLFYNVTAPYQAGNIFSAELSDNNGSFQTALVVGTVAGTTNGVIYCTIPQTVLPGGGYRLRISASAPMTKGSCTVPLFLNLPPIPEVTVHGDTLISSTAANYQWLKNNTPVAGATNQRLVTKVSGWYKVKVTDPVTGCSSYSDSVAVGNVHIGQLTDIRSMVQVYPNPADRQINVNFASSLTDMQQYKLTISTPSGKRIMEYSDLQHKNKIDLTALAEGIYFIEINGPAGKGVFKIIKR